MPQLPLRGNSAWNSRQVESFLNDTRVPMRIACVAGDGYPAVCSLWFFYEDGHLWAATHRNAYIVRLLRKNARVGFEIATNEVPYRGVRGKADVSLHQGEGGPVLARLIDRYLSGTNPQLADWLMSRADEEYALCLSPVTVNSWDYSGRMSP